MAVGISGRCEAKRTPSRWNAVPLHLSPERHSADLQGGGGSLAVALESLQRALDHEAFLFGKVERIVAGAYPGLLRHLWRQIAHTDAGAVGKDDRSFHRMFELADIAGHR